MVDWELNVKNLSVCLSVFLSISLSISLTVGMQAHDIYDVLFWFVQPSPDVETPEDRERRDAYNERFFEMEFRALRAFFMHYEESGTFDKW